MKIGLLAYSSQTGLGYQTREFYKHIECAKVLVPDLQGYNLMPLDHSWCPEARIVQGFPSDADMEWLVEGMDIVFYCESPLNFHLLQHAFLEGVPTVNQYNYEFCDYIRDNVAYPEPTVMASPTVWGMEHVKQNHPDVRLWPVPVDTVAIEARNINKVSAFVHILGRPAAEDRNGTMAFLDAVEILGREFSYKIIVQIPKDEGSMRNFRPIAKRIAELQLQIGDDKLNLITDVSNNLDIYKQGECLVLPRRYGGLCLPMWEALASGLPVIMPRIQPNTSVLPFEWLVPAEIGGVTHIATELPLYDVDRDSLVEKMRWIVDNITDASKVARQVAEANSWEVQKPIYLERFDYLCG